MRLSLNCARRNGFFSAITDGQLNSRVPYEDSNGEIHPTDPVINNLQQDKYAIDSRPMFSSTASQPMQNPQRMRQSEDTGPPWAVQHPQPRSGIRRSSLWFGGEAEQVTGNRQLPVNPTERTTSLAPYTAAATSLPNLNRKPLSNAEQHKLELLQQIEENKRRRQLELEKERMEEQKEMERLERYNEKVRKEKEEEERKLRERARLAEKRAEQMYESRPKPQRMRSPPPPRKEHVSPTPSETPALEWWEKKPSWQQKAEDERVIPALGGKPPRTPSRRASSRRASALYDPAASVENHQSREGSSMSHRSEERSRPASVARQADSRVSHHNDERPPSIARRAPSRSSRRASRQDTQVCTQLPTAKPKSVLDKKMHYSTRIGRL
ncbi:hypothetical protein COOONC_04753 [Cooperia oncophora]